MDDLIAFLRARLHEDERDALLALRGYPDGRPETMQPWKRSARWQAGDGRVTIEYADQLPAMVEQKRPVLAHVDRCQDSAIAHIARHDPARVLADVAAKRQIIALHERTVSEYDTRRPDGTPVHVRNEFCDGCQAEDGVITGQWPCLTLRLLALPFAGHPDYRESWRP